jgi:hypothetical protein
MYITKEQLVHHGACGQGLKWFERTFPNGAELIDVINHKYASPHFLHWGYANLSTSEGERAAYRVKLKIDCGNNNYTIYESDNIKDSIYVTHSSNVENSGYVFNSEDVVNSNNILKSKIVENSFQVYESEFVYDSHRIVKGKNITNSREIVYSDYVINSHHIMYAAAVKNSAWISDISFGLTKRINNSYFISRGQDLDHCMFCSGLEGKKYHIFNTEVSSDEYEIIKKQLFSILKDWKPEIVVDDEWPEATIPLDAPRIQRNLIRQYAGLPDKFWRWVSTLPGYDPSILYSITYQSILMEI